jgi:hypothetical protein
MAHASFSVASDRADATCNAPPPVESAAADKASPLLTRARAAEHVLHAIADAREELLTAALVALVGTATCVQPHPTLATHWAYGGHWFAKSGAVGVVAAAGVVTAPREAPTLLVGGAAIAVGQGVTLLKGAPGELRRALGEERFMTQFGFKKDELRWSLIPASTRFWYLAQGDSMVELALKAKRGPLGMGSSTAKMGRLLGRVLELTAPPLERPHVLQAAIRSATLRCLLLCYAMLCYAMLCYAMLCYAMLCYAMLCYAMLCCAML